MRFKLQNGEMVLRRESVVEEMVNSFPPLSESYIVDFRETKDYIKNMDFLKGKTLSIVPVVALGVAVDGGSGIFWQTFMKYIFPYMMDIAKVFCAIKIAQAFYNEKRGGREEGSGFGAFVTYGKWYLLFALMPWCVELFDQLGDKMLLDLRTGN